MQTRHLTSIAPWTLTVIPYAANVDCAHIRIHNVGMTNSCSRRQTIHPCSGMTNCPPSNELGAMTSCENVNVESIVLFDSDADLDDATEPMGTMPWLEEGVG